MPSDQKVYIVHDEIGEDIAGVFSTRENAEAWLKTIPEIEPGGGTGHVIEEWAVDANL